ncbi:hypothetical protein [Helicobacter sp. T3_23-1059]
MEIQNKPPPLAQGGFIFCPLPCGEGLREGEITPSLREKQAKAQFR